MNHQVKIEQEDICFEVGPEESVLEAARKQGINLPYGCGSGECGTCAVRVIRGTWEYLYGYTPGVLSPSEIEQGWALICKATPKSDLDLGLRHRLERRYECRTLSARIEKKEPVAADVWCLHLRLPKGESLPFHPGQYVHFILDGGEKRAFSMAAPSSESGLLEFHVRHFPGGYFSDTVLGSLNVGDEIRIEGPLGGFRLDEESTRPAIFVAGGTGFAPLRPMLEKRLEKMMEAPTWLYWGTRGANCFYHSKLIEQWQRDCRHFRFVPVVSEAQATWAGRAGLVHKAVVEDHADLSGFDIYMAGPPPMIEAARKVFPAYGLNDERTFCEEFHPGSGTPANKKRGFGAGLRRLFGGK